MPLATGSVRRDEAPGRIGRGMPEPIPVMVLGRLAVDRGWQGKGVAKGLLKDAVSRTLMVTKQAGIRALVVHALSVEAKGFYPRHGFVASPLADCGVILISVRGKSMKRAGKCGPDFQGKTCDARFRDRYSRSDLVPYNLPVPFVSPS